jgi:hypothetical protein
MLSIYKSAISRDKMDEMKPINGKENIKMSL